MLFDELSFHDLNVFQSLDIRSYLFFTVCYGHNLDFLVVLAINKNKSPSVGNTSINCEGP